MSDFNERPFVAGSLTGIRSWIVDKYGRLRASQVNVVWLPGENVGRCMKAEISGSSSSMSMMLQSITWQALGGGGLTYGNGTRPEPAAISVEKIRPECDEHKAGAISCTCGFYAYFDNGPNQYHQTGNVLGIVEGYGVTTVGTRGFRSEKARVKALIVKPKQYGTLVDRVLVNYPDLPVFNTKREAFAEYPLTPPTDGPTPETDAQFWTRDAL